MAEVKVSQLPATTTISNGSVDTLMIIQGGVNKKIVLSDLFKNIRSDVIVNPDQGDIDVTMNGQASANLFKLDAFLGRVGIGIESPQALFHVNGDAKVGSSTSPGRVIVSDEEIIIPDTPGALSVNPAYSVTKIKTTGLSILTQTITIGSPTNSQIKVVTFATADPAKMTGLNYTLSGSFVGYSQIKFTKLGDSVILLGVGTSWAIIGYNGVNLI